MPPLDFRELQARVRGGSGRRFRLLWAIQAWVFGHVPRPLTQKVRAKHPGFRIVEIRRGSALDLRAQSPGLSFVAAPEIRCWLALSRESL